MQSTTPEDNATCGEIHAKLEGVLGVLNDLDVRALGQSPEASVNNVLNRIEVIRATAVQLRGRIKQQLKGRAEEAADEGPGQRPVLPIKRGFSRSFGRQQQGNELKAQRRAAKADFADRIAGLHRDAAQEQNQRIDWALSILGASRSTHANELKALYRYMARQTHPDARLAEGTAPSDTAGRDQPDFADLQRAWEILTVCGLVNK